MKTMCIVLNDSCKNVRLLSSGVVLRRDYFSLRVSSPLSHAHQRSAKRSSGKESGKGVTSRAFAAQFRGYTARTFEKGLL